MGDAAEAGMRFSVVVPVRDDSEGLRLALGGVQQQTRPPDEVLVVNAGEAPLGLPSPSELPIRIVESGRALPGGARNAGAREARGEWLAFLDAGTRPVPQWLDSFRMATELRSDVDVVYGCYVPSLRNAWDLAAAGAYLPPRPAPNAGSHPTTASLCVRRSYWETTGGMHPDLRAGEDLLFFRRLESLRAVTVVAPGARVDWQLPAGALGHFRRLRRYSRATWPTDLARQWQRPLLRMYALALAMIVIGPALHPAVAVGLPALVGLRIARNYRLRMRGLPARLTPVGALRLVAMAGLADVATLLGIFDSLEGRPAS